MNSESFFRVAGNELESDGREIKISPRKEIRMSRERYVCYSFIMNISTTYLLQCTKIMSAVENPFTFRNGKRIKKKKASYVPIARI